MPDYVVRHIDRPDPQIAAGLESAGVATVHEAYGRRGLMDPGIRPIQFDRTIGGTAVTVSCAAGDNIMIHAAVEVVAPGDVLVVTTTEPSTDGMFGDLLATSLQTRGVVGLVIEAGVRDTSTLRDMRFPVWSRAVHSQGTVKATPGSVNMPIACGGTTVNPGDIIVADDDGVVVVAAGEAADTLAAANNRLENEEAMRERFAAGELGLDIYGLREKLEGLGVSWVDRLDNHE